MTDTEVDRKWDELADRGDLRVFMQRMDNRFDQIERLQWIKIITFVCGLIALSLK
jgi:hypothetical protein